MNDASPPESPSLGLPQHRLEVLYQVSRSLGSLLEWSDLVQGMMDMVMKTLNAERGVLFLRGPDGSPVPEVVRGADESTLQDATETSRRILERSLVRGEAILSDDAQSDERFKSSQSVMRLRIVSFMCVPLRRGDRILGTLYVDNRSITALFHKEDLAFLSALADLCAIALENARMHEDLKVEVRQLRRDVQGKYRFENILGTSERMVKLFKILERVVESDATILIQGENGTGKELVARAIHFNSRRKEKPFVTVDCGSLPEHLAGSELFGHKRGAFTDAREDRRGMFEEASDGTVFLDQVEDLPLPLQPQLLRVLQEGEVRRLGETTYRKVNTRVLAASRIDLAEKVKDGSFREDLYFRLRVVPIDLPPLRERKADITVLAQNFLERVRERQPDAPKGFSRAAMDFMVAYRWPGNVRELQHSVERAALLATESRIQPEDLGLDPGFGGQTSLVEARRNTEEARLREALLETRGNVSHAAVALGVSRRTLQHMMKRHSLTREEFR
jgi:Nif-specific regulatory protein